MAREITSERKKSMGKERKELAQLGFISSNQSIQDKKQQEVRWGQCVYVCVWIFMYVFMYMFVLCMSV